MPPAIVAAGIGAAGAIGGGILANKGASKAAKATQQASDQSAAVTQQIYGQNVAALAPWQQSGMAANQQINALLGLGGVQAAPAPQVQSYYSGVNPAASPFPQRMVESALYRNGVGYMPSQIAQVRQWLAQQQAPKAAPQPVAQANPQQAANNAFDIFRNSTGYQFRLKEGANAANSLYAGSGVLQSGAAAKALQDYGQNMASQEFGNYLGALGNQQSLGFSAASAQAGVGQNYSNSLANIYQNQGANNANAALLKSQNNAQMLNSLATIGSGLFGRIG